MPGDWENSTHRIVKSRVRKLRRRYWLTDPHCHYCGCKLAWEETTLDHVVPRIRGGKATEENTVLACEDCNHAKGEKEPPVQNERMHQ